MAISMEKIRFRRAIEINANASGILKLPCVISACKRFDDKCEGGYSIVYCLFGDTITDLFKWGEQILGNYGDWICEDYNGKWHLLSSEEYENNKLW